MPMPRVLRELASRVRHTLRGRAMESRVRDEMQFHVDELTARYRARGLSEDDARRAARIAFGATARFRDEARDELRGRIGGELAQDLRYALRGIRHRPLLTATIVVTLALGIGAVTTVFSLVNEIVLEPLPYPNAGRLVAVQQGWTGRDPGPGSISPAEYFDYVDDAHAFSSFGVYAFGRADVAAGDQPEQIPEALVSGGVFAALGTRAVVGRTIAPLDDRPGANPVALIAYGLWKRRFGGRTSIVGRSLLIDGHTATVVGVLPDGFRLPDEMSSALPAELFVPLRLDRGAVRIRGSHFLSGIASLAHGSSMAAAQLDVASVARAFTARYPADYPAGMNFTGRATDLRSAVVGGTRPILLLLLAAVGCVFLVACVNAASLMLAQAETRRLEMAVRTALGAARSRLVRQLLAESLVIAVIAGACGVALAELGTGLFVRWPPMQLPRIAALAVDWRVMAFAAGATFFAAAAAAWLPARHLIAADDLQRSLRAGGRGVSGATRRGARRMLVTGEIATAAVLLLSSGLLVTSVRRLLAVDPGFNVDHVLTVAVALPDGAFPSDASVITLYEQLVQRVRAVPGARAAGAVAGVPLEAPRGDLGIELEGHPVPPGAVHPRADWQVVTPGYFDAIGMRLRRGRLLTSFDRGDTRGVVVINRAMAERYWPGTDALGHRFKLGGGAKPDTVTVVGIVDDVRQGGLAVTPEPEMYFAQSQFRFWGGGGMERAMSLVVATAADPMQLVPAVRRAVHQAAPSVALGPMRTMRDLRSASVAEPRFMMLLLLAAAAVALVIAMAGVYALVAFSVQHRRREFGMRIALGARRGDIARLVLGECVTLAVGGVLVGVPMALAFAQLLRRWLYGVTSTEPVLLVAVPIALTLVTLLAGYWPARRASRADPMAALRND